jgi:hypothetical protein
MMTLITTTGTRPEAFGLCQKWMKAQTYKGAVRWIIVDDGQEAQPIKFRRSGWTLDVVRPEPFWEPGQNTQARNLRCALDRVNPDDKVLIIEDDDYYAPTWIEQVDAALEKAELVGETRARYYNIRTKIYRQLENKGHASLCATGMRGAAVETLRSVCRPSIQFIDLLLWQAHSSKYLFDGHLTVGIKGLPGRGGIGMGHDKKFTGYSDHSGKILQEWVGNAAKDYERLCSK